MDTMEKENMLNNLADSVGYSYDSSQDIFVSRLDAPQKHFGYNSFFDFSAPFLNMIFDYETIYFDYNGRTWMVEMWKGQYGINTGCELGVYYADEIIPPEKYATTHFNAVDYKDMPEISLSLSRISPNAMGYQELANLYHNHWWLAIFKMGLFTKPQDLLVNTAIRFKSYPLLRHFVESFKQALPDTPYNINGLTVYFAFCNSKRKYTPIRRFIRRLALISCYLYCKWFNYITRPFQSSGDKILYLYYYLPFIIRNMIQTKIQK